MNMLNLYCLGKKIVKVLMQHSALLNGVIAYARTHTFPLCDMVAEKTTLCYHVAKWKRVHRKKDFFIFLPVGGSSADTPHGHFGGLSQNDLCK